MDAPPNRLGWRKIMIKQITIGIAALALGVAFAAAPASAQARYGRALNDGGLVDGPGAPSKPIYNEVKPMPATTPHFGRAFNDGGIVDAPPAALMAANARIKWAQSPPHYGRALNDGGF
jgi:hypothetical protein